VYYAEERNSAQFRDDFIKAINESRRIHCLLISAYTMVHEDEQFIFNHLVNKLSASNLRKKDIRILLLDRKSDIWLRRATLFIQNRLGQDDITLEGYRIRCEDAERRLRNQCNAKIQFYDQDPRWRLYIFDRRLFISRYFSPPEGEFLEGHLGDVAAFHIGHPAYNWFYWEFKKYCPDAWNDLNPPVAH
jgi:hypothetical protein